jgi:hypothetical protein
VSTASKSNFKRKVTNKKPILICLCAERDGSATCKSFLLPPLQALLLQFEHEDFVISVSDIKKEGKEEVIHEQMLAIRWIWVRLRLGWINLYINFFYRF